jgi:putative CocE/NonD family hydrolase
VNRPQFLAFLCVALLAALPCPVSAQGMDVIKSTYTKYEYRLRMRDGTRLFTVVYVPKDDSQKYPILLTRTPYGVGPYGSGRSKDKLGPSDLFAKAGYIFAYQDVRGRWMSEGTHVNMRPHKPDKEGKDFDESSDTFDTIDWLVKNVPNNNGKVGLWGISYPGFYTAAGMIDAHPALKAASPQAPIVDWFIGDDFHRNGVLWLPHLFNFIANFGRTRQGPTKKPVFPFEHDTPDGYDFFLRLGPLSNADRKYFKGSVPFWNEVMEHGNYDAFWKARNLRPHLKKIKPAVMTVGGWFDAENLFGALETYRTVDANSPGDANILVMGPWDHGGWERGDGKTLGNVSFDSATSTHYREKIELPFFEHHLKGKGQRHPRAIVFETGTNVWRKHDTWPPKGSRPRSLYFRANGRLAQEAPGEAKAEEAHDEYVSDPAKPVPFQEKIAIGMSVEYMTADQRFAARRPDVLTYKTAPLEEELTLAGPIDVELHVSTSGTDSDWVVKVIDVYPDDYPDPIPNPSNVRLGGYQQLLRGDAMRGKFRNSFEKPEAFEPGKPTRVRFRLQDVYHTFRTGHRIMVQVQSSWFPLADRNPQTFVDIYKAKESDFKKASQRVYRTRALPSRVTVTVKP